MKKLPKKETVFLGIEFLLFLIAIGFLVFRIQRGVDLTDESWYVADPYLVAKGHIPYLNNWTQTPGFSFPLAILFSIYSAFFGTEGIVLFSRCLYLVWLLLVALLTIVIVRKKAGDTIPVVWYLPLLLTTYSLFDVDYNSIGIVYFPLILALLYFAWEKEGKDAFRIGILSGLIAARTIIGTPTIMLPCAVLVAALLIKKRKHLLLGFMAGGLAAAVIVVGWVCIRGGVGKFIYGFYALIKDLTYFKIQSRHGLKADIEYLAKYMRPAFIYFGIVLLLRIPVIPKATASRLIRLAAWAFLLYGLGRTLYEVARYDVSFKDIQRLVKYSWFESFGLALMPEKENREPQFFFAAILYVLVYLFSSYSNVYGFGSREYWLIMPAAISYISAYRMVSYCICFRITLLAGLAMFFLVQRLLSYNYVYRDSPIKTLTTKVDAGIWKGCYTTESRAKDVVGLESYIRSVTDEEDEVFFQDWVSFAYLMNRGKACTPSALDPCTYTYGTNYPEILYDYYYSEEKVPGKIIYIDFGRDSLLSIENPEWSYNEFVETCYQYSGEYKNDSFRVLVYQLKDEAGAIKFANDRASKLMSFR